jgi:choline transport protein
MFCLGDIDSALKSSTGQPYIAVILNATVLAIVILILVVLCSVNLVTTTSRQLW